MRRSRRQAAPRACRCRIARSTPRPAGSSTTPRNCWPTSAACLDAAGAADGAIGLDNQGESCLAWDAATGGAIGPVIVWQDDRTARRDRPACARDGAEALMLARAGLPLDPYFSASQAGLDPAHDAEAAASWPRRGHLRLGTTDAFFRDRLTGRFETDVTTASRTSLMNLATCAWDAELCAPLRRADGLPAARSRRPPGDLGGPCARRVPADRQRSSTSRRPFTAMAAAGRATPRSPSAPAPSRWP